MTRLLMLVVSAVGLQTSLGFLAAAGPRHARSRVLFAEGDPIAGIQFYPGVWEPNVPDVKLTRSKDAQTGTATFKFDAPSFFNIEKEEDIPKDSITEMRMIDEEGSFETAKINANFINGQ